MIKVSVMYPCVEGARFDIDYYEKCHIPMVRVALGESLKRMELDRGLSGGGKQPPIYVAVGNMYFDTVEDFQNSFGKSSAKILGDIVNYTDLQPLMQISEVV